MMWIERNPIPEVCETCQQQDCYNCDTAGERWYLSQEDELRVVRKGLIKMVARLKKRIEEIDRELDDLTKQ